MPHSQEREAYLPGLDQEFYQEQRVNIDMDIGETTVNHGAKLICI